MAIELQLFAVVDEKIVVPSQDDFKNGKKQKAKSIAVLPFVNMRSNLENEYFSDGITEEIINALSNINELKVTSCTSSFHFKDTNILIHEIRKQLSVSTVLEGSVRISGNKMRITAQLIDVEADYHFWSETFDREVNDIFDVQDEVSLIIADKLREHLGHFDIGQRLAEEYNVPMDAYRLFLKGWYYIMKLNRDDALQGIGLLKEVIALEPNFVQPYLAINQGYTFMGTIGLMSATEWFFMAKPFLDRAISLLQNIAEVQLNLAWIACCQDWDLPKTCDHLHQALAMRPSDTIFLDDGQYVSGRRQLKSSHILYQ